MLSKKQLEHLERRLQSERDKAIKALGRFGRRTKLDREVMDSDLVPILIIWLIRELKLWSGRRQLFLLAKREDIFID